MKITETKLRKIIRRTIMEYGGGKKSADEIARDIEEAVYNGQLSGDPDSLYQEAVARCEANGCADQVDFVAEKVIMSVMQSGF